MRLNFLSCVFLIAFVACAKPANAGTRVIDWMHFNGMLSAVAADDYKAFCSHGPEISTNIPESEFDEIVSFLRPILLKGFNAENTGYTEKSRRDIFATWSLFYESKKPKVIVRLDFSGPGGDVVNFSLE